MSGARVDGTPWAQAARTRAGVYAVGLTLGLPMVLLFASAVAAQTAQPARSNRGLFGPPDENPKRQQSSDFTMGLSAGYDTNASDGQQAGPLIDPLAPAGLYSNLETAFRYTRGRRQRRLAFSAGNALRYEPQRHQLLTANYEGGLTVTSPVWRGASVDLSQTAAYAPYYQLELFPTFSVDAGQLPRAPSNDFGVWRQPTYAYTTTLHFAQKLGARSAVLLEYDRRSVQFTGDASAFLTQGAAVRFTHRMTRYVGFHAAFGSRSGRYQGPSTANRPGTDDIDIGLDYNRPLSFSRRTTLSFSSGSSLIPQDGTRRYRVTGEASLQHQIGRTWAAGLEYRRALRFIEAFPKPFFSDAIAARLKGNLSRRVEFAVSGGYSAGEIGLAAEGGAFGTYTASALLGVALTRHCALASEYLYYDYSFGQQPVAAAFPARLNRQTARVTLKLWLPVLH